ncbi:aminoglycoside phosphotransferase family protein [Fluoribacter dumoffii]|uniref:Serine/threonine protein kinase n=1 Tax=Fluoribacter dumoffii TaxID=463 RepID=A0A377G7L9_9GAMM|nr:phosphotransferase [Fluoribacter dumoffii]KTC89641.1 spectinomycin phosphotransferase [Fluoribacter dumoffii NY 23]MCW8384834.1 aminoglycoside phosphotransferase family protein [Fluoribacter dumoffii]MCW8496766.1 aminoglycoside phosphotransferase family protein [Fluoribacter dumoffii]STO20753.1 serine/threonine protein kinase [Fluoribacter dumoffii]
MFDKQAITDQQIIECLRRAYRINALKLSQLALGADMNASLYKADSPDQSYFVKLKKGTFQDVGLDVVKLLSHNAIQQIIQPIATSAKQPVLDIDPFCLIVYPFIKGENGFNQELTEEQWITLGKTLKRIHEINCPDFIAQRIRKESYPAKWRKNVRAFLKQIEGIVAVEEFAFKLLTFIKEKLGIIIKLVERAEYLAQRVQNSPRKLVLCHSDLHAGNVLLTSDQSFYIVDWDEPIMAPKERDLMFIGGGVANVWNLPYQEDLFYQGYGKTEIDPMLLTFYRCERILEDIVIYTQQFFSRASENRNDVQTYHHFIDMFAPNGVVDIALSTTV